MLEITIDNTNYIFPDGLIEKMSNSVIESNSTNQETEFNLCAEDGVIFDSTDCEKNHAKTIGSFRIYPRTKRAEQRTKDILDGYKYGMTCVGATDEIVCMVRKGYHNDDVYQRMQDIINRDNDLSKIFDALKQEKNKFINEYIRSGNLNVIDIPLDVDELKIALEFEGFSGLPLAQFILPIDVIQKMIDLIKEGEKIHKEVGFDLCSGSDNIIRARNECIGEEHCIITKRKCETNESIIGSFHTHSHRDKEVVISSGDLLSLYRYGVECIGAKEELKCFLRYEFDEKVLEFLRDLDKATDITIEEKEKVRKEKIWFGRKYFSEVKIS